MQSVIGSQTTVAATQRVPDPKDAATNIMNYPPVPGFRVPVLPLPRKKSQDTGLIRQPCSQFEEKMLHSNL